MVQRVATVAFEGIEARAVDVQVQVAPGLPAFKSWGSGQGVSEARERVRSALIASPAFPFPPPHHFQPRPAYLPKECSHYDLPTRSLMAHRRDPHDASRLHVLASLVSTAPSRALQACCRRHRRERRRRV